MSENPGILQKKGKIIVACIIIVVITVIISACVAVRYRNYQTEVRRMSFSNVNIRSVPDGIYIGECDVDVLYARVAVAVRNGAIVDVTLLEHKNERGEKAENIITEVIKQQRLDVDAVASATNSSKVIRKAMENALLQK